LLREGGYSEERGFAPLKNLFPLWRGIKKKSQREAKPLSKILFPLSF